MSLKAVIFDFGGVLMRTDDWSGRRTWESRLGLAAGESEDIVFGAANNHALQLGRTTDAQHWQWVASRLGLSQTELQEFRRDFYAADALDASLIGYLRRLKDSYHVGLLSNAPAGARQALRDEYGLLDLFDSVTLSGEEGVMKPDERIYRVALARADVRPEDSVFVDDVLANVEAARQLGMRGLHFRDTAATLDELVALTGVT